MCGRSFYPRRIEDISRFTAVFIDILFSAMGRLRRQPPKVVMQEGPWSTVADHLQINCLRQPSYQTRGYSARASESALHHDCGEIVQAVALHQALLVATTGYYTLLQAVGNYYIALFIPRQIDDDLQIATKYGEAALGEEYQRVPWGSCRVSK